MTKQKPTTASASKIHTLMALLERPEGATIEQLSQATGWQPHSVRGAISGTLKKKQKLSVTSEKVDGTRVYRIGANA